MRKRTVTLSSLVLILKTRLSLMVKYLIALLFLIISCEYPLHIRESLLEACLFSFCTCIDMEIPLSNKVYPVNLYVSR
ncbi:hypothetical protein F4810DRAFT_22517 [Camillea tinctor]|nr:hypothetical protein F4810DRAFT_22517 [Camillea tinctor]